MVPVVFVWCRWCLVGTGVVCAVPVVFVWCQSVVLIRYRVVLVWGSEVSKPCCL